jgi:hypothetical protein
MISTTSSTRSSRAVLVACHASNSFGGAGSLAALLAARRGLLAALLAALGATALALDTALTVARARDRSAVGRFVTPPGDLALREAGFFWRVMALHSETYRENAFGSTVRIRVRRPTYRERGVDLD